MAYGDGDWIRDLDSEVIRLRAQVKLLRLQNRLLGDAVALIRRTDHRHRGGPTSRSLRRCAACIALQAYVRASNEVIRHNLRARRAAARKATAKKAAIGAPTTPGASAYKPPLIEETAGQ